MCNNWIEKNTEYDVYVIAYDRAGNSKKSNVFLEKSVVFQKLDLYKVISKSYRTIFSKSDNMKIKKN